ncbi:MAG: hypothetical protein LUE12_00400 [Ruminococcus sp.]|nr:hypothetical protein [Ruminococcus sp.]
MKIKKIFAGMAASAIAMSTFAMTATTEASALDTAGNAGIAFQTNTTWNYRDIYGTDGDYAVFPQTQVGIQGGAYGFDTDVECGDTTIQYDGTYTVSIATSGTLDEQGSATGWADSEDSSLTREGSTWSMLYNTEPANDTYTEWETGGETDKFNMLIVTTDIECTYEDGVAYVDGEEITVTDLVVDMCGTEYTADTVYMKDDLDTLGIAVINAYGDSSIDADALPTEDGTITITFTISGLGEDPDADSSDEDSSDEDSSEDSSEDTTSSTSSTTTTTTTTSSSASTTTSDATSDDTTESAESGAPARVALALAAVAGAALVVTRRK